MAVKKYITTALVLGFLAPHVMATNNLVQLDLKRVSDDSVNLTLVTTESYVDNVMVRKKSDNKYVILVPKVHSSGYKNSNLASVHDLVRGVDVKTVEDTSGGYTKITLITTRPLEIKTHTAKRLPASPEMQEYDTLMAQANMIKNNISRKIENPKPQKTEVTTDKAPASAQKVSQISQSTTTAKQKPKIQLTEITPEKIEKTLMQKTREVSDSIETIIPESSPAVEEPVSSEIKDISEMPAPQASTTKKSVSIKALMLKIAKTAKKALPSGKVLIGLVLLAGIVSLLRRKDKVVQTSENKLSWQELYNHYLGKTATPLENYAFVKANNIQAKREQLERMVTAENEEMQQQKSFVDEEAIQKTIKFTAFDNPIVSLRMSDRNNRFKKYSKETPAMVQENVELGESALHSNPRSLKDANLKISDVNSDYIMSSMEEYFADEIEGLTVKSTFDIDQNRSFYLVNREGHNSLVGKVNDEIFVLKNLPTDKADSLQVRKDEENVYMVKAGDYKSLVEVDDEKMGVLIEL